MKSKTGPKRTASSPPAKARLVFTRSTLAAGAMVAVFGAAAASQFRLHTFHQKRTFDLATKTGNYTKRVPIPAQRGQILTADGQPLARNDDSYRLEVRVDKVPRTDTFYAALARASGVPASELATLVNTYAPRSPEETGRTLDWPEAIRGARAAAVRQLKLDWRVDGVSLRSSGRRDFPLGESLSTFAGVTPDGRPFGLELTFNDQLSGKPGERVGLLDRSGAMLPSRIGHQTAAIDGKNIELTIDSRLQAAAVREVRKAVEEHNADSGVAIIMDPHTGNILAMASWPLYNPEDPFRTPGFNAASTLTLEPGSTFKILTLAKALDAGLWTDHETLNCQGTLRLNRFWKISCDRSHGNGRHDRVDSEKAIAMSCNVAAATWANRIQYAPFVRYMEQLGLLSKTRVGLPGESVGQFKRDEYAKPLQLLQFGFGQSVTTTPLALASAFCTLANDGERMVPRLISRIGDQPTPYRSAGFLLKKETTDRLLAHMEAVVQSDQGTGKTLRIPGYRLGGKTGTAQKIRGKGQRGNVSNFVGFVPANAPEAVILVMIDRPKGRTVYGSAVAGPVFTALAREVIRINEIPPSGSLVAQKPTRPAGPQVSLASQPSRGTTPPQ